MLIKQPEERITLDQALAHKWFRKIRARFERQETAQAAPKLGLRQAATMRNGGSVAGTSNSMAAEGGMVSRNNESPQQQQMARSRTNYER